MFRRIRPRTWRFSKFMWKYFASSILLRFMSWLTKINVTTPSSGIPRRRWNFPWLCFDVFIYFRAAWAVKSCNFNLFAEFQKKRLAKIRQAMDSPIVCMEFHRQWGQSHFIRTITCEKIIKCKNFPTTFTSKLFWI